MSLSDSSICTGPQSRQISDTCYFLSQHAGLSWAAASQQCQSQGGELATVDNDLLQLALRNWIAATFRDQNKKVWVGAYKNGWYWMAGERWSGVKMKITVLNCYLAVHCPNVMWCNGYFLSDNVTLGRMYIEWICYSSLVCSLDFVSYHHTLSVPIPELVGGSYQRWIANTYSGW